MKHLLFFWKYLTDPHFRFWADWTTRKEHLDRAMNEIQENLRYQNNPLFLVDSQGNIKHLKKEQDMTV